MFWTPAFGRPPLDARLWTPAFGRPPLDARLWTPAWGGRPGILHFLGICPKHSYKRELQTASDTTAIPACSIRRHEGRLHRCRQPPYYSTCSHSHRTCKKNDVHQSCSAAQNCNIGSMVRSYLSQSFVLARIADALPMFWTSGNTAYIHTRSHTHSQPF
jgi:hypothetical protein